LRGSASAALAARLPVTLALSTALLPLAPSLGLALLPSTPPLLTLAALALLVLLAPPTPIFTALTAPLHSLARPARAPGEPVAAERVGCVLYVL